METILRKHVTLIIAWGIVVAIVVLVVSLFLPASYGAESAVLIISRDRSGVDPYTQAKSAERIGENLVAVMQTDDFFRKVLESDTGFNKQRWLNLNDRARRKKWQRDVSAAVAPGTSLLKIISYSKEPQDALRLASSVTETVASQGWQYVGGDIVIKVVNNPLLSPWQRRPNVILNTLAGFVLGSALSMLWLVSYKRVR